MQTFYSKLYSDNICIFHPVENRNNLPKIELNRSLNLNFLDIQCYESSNHPYYTCSCPPGYEFTQTTCVDIDEVGIFLKN